MQKEFKPISSKKFLNQLKNISYSNKQEFESMIKSIEFNNPGIGQKIIDSFKTIDRKFFVKNHPYEDMALHIAHGQTISQPTTIARMLRMLKLEPGQNVLEIGSNTGYHAALVSYLISPGNVTTIEIFPDLAHQARINLKRLILELEYKKVQTELHVQVVTGDALDKKQEIWRKKYDRIYYTAHVSPENIGKVKKLAKFSLNDEGLLLFPTGESNIAGSIEVWQKNGKRLELIKKEYGYAFVPVIRQKDIENLYKK